jgi:DNA polymerase I-like protein with 3'-5' exonuclease and polymerase domains
LNLGRKKRRDYSGPTLPEVDGAFITDTPEKVGQALRMIRDAEVVGFDTETVGCDPRKEHAKGKARAICAQFSCGYDPGAPGSRIFVPNWGPWEGTLRHFKGVLEDPDIGKVGSNLKYDMHVCGNHGITLDGFAGDTQVMDTLSASGEMYHGLKHIMERYFGYKLITLFGETWGAIREYSETFKRPKLKRDGTPSKTFEVPHLDEVVQDPVGVHRLITYACKDPLFSLMGFEVLRAALEAEEWVNGKSYWDYYKQFDLPYTQVLYRMERRGCRVDTVRLEEMKLQVDAKIEDTVSEFLRTCQKYGVSNDVLADFNLGSSKQVANLFEVHLRTPIAKRTPTGLPSTDDDSLTSFKDPVAKQIADIILAYRELDKLRGTYVEPFIHSAGEYGGKVHTNLKQTGTATLRLSSSAHNLQNIPSMENDAFHIREAFIAPDGCVVGDIDLSQIELRLAAHFTNDAVMLNAINRGWDLHSLTATEIDSEVRRWVGARTVDGDLLHEVKAKFPEARRRSKTINFGCIAEGQRVLTKRGLVPIERVQDSDLLWDGVEWVHHEGVVFKGEKAVLTYDGLTATLGHEVYTDEGHKIPFGLAASTVRFGRLAVGGAGEAAVGYDAFDRRGRAAREAGVEGEKVRRGGVLRVRKEALASSGQRSREENYELPMPARAEVPRFPGGDARSSVRRDGTEVREGHACLVPPVQGEGHQGLVSVEGALRTLGVEEVVGLYLQRLGVRSDRQRWTLLAAESEADHLFYQQPKQVARVYDIVNAGPRHRFTVEGRVVGNTLYGMGPSTYAQMAGVSEQAGKEAVQGFFNLYAGMRSGIDRIQRRARQDGFVRTILRRRVAIPFINSDEMGLRRRAERQAFNYVIQGSAADLLKMSMLLIDADKRLEELGVEMTLQIHDELLFNVPKGAEEECRPIIEEYVSHPYRVYGFKDLRVDTPAEIGFGESWGKAKQ